MEGLPAFASLAEVLKKVPAADLAVSIITPPKVSLGVLEAALAAGVRGVWLQPGAEDSAVMDVARKHPQNVVAGGPCLLVALRAGPLDD